VVQIRKQEKPQAQLAVFKILPVLKLYCS